MNPVNDSRLHSWPKVFRGRGKLVLSAKVLNPYRLQLLATFIFKPLTFVWRLCLFVLILDLIARYFQGVSYLDRLITIFLDLPRPNRALAFSVLAMIWAAWKFEKKSGHEICRVLFGERFRLVMTHDRLKVGGWIRNLRMNRGMTMTFSNQPLEDIKPEKQEAFKMHQESQQLMLVIDDSRSVRVASIYTLKRARQVVENANMALRIGVEEDEPDLDIDPTRARAD